MRAPPKRLTRVEWDEARRLYEVEGWTADTIADYFGVSTAAVDQHRAKESWTKPSGAVHYTQPQLRSRERLKAIRAKAETEVSERVAVQVSHQLDLLTGQAREEAIVEANAMEVSRVMLLHRSGATQVRELVSQLFRELQLISVPQEHLQALVELVAKTMNQEIEDEKLQKKAERQTVQAFNDLLGLGNRADIAKKLVDAMCKMVDLERRVYGIRDEASEGDVAKALKELADLND